MILNADNIHDLNTGNRILHNNAYDSYAPQHSQFCTETSSTGPQVIYTWLEALNTGLKLKNGPTKWGNFGATQWTVQNQEFEDGCEIGQTFLEDDTYGAFAPKFQEMGQLAAAHPDKLFFDLLKNGFVEKDYTDRPFFSTDKKHVKVLGNAATNVFSNLLEEPLTAASFGTARQMIVDLKRPDGYPYSLITKLVLVTSPELTEHARKILKASLVNAGETNVWQGEAMHMESNFLSGPAWYLLNVGGFIRPMIRQNRLALQFHALTNPDLINTLTDGNVRYKNRVRYALEYGMPQFAVGSTGEA
jgi:phage major head subunit gpT-like protein